MDGSTDDIVTEQETIFIRTCVQGKTMRLIVNQSVSRVKMKLLEMSTNL